MSSIKFDAKHWRERAAQARTQAEQIDDPETGRRLLTVAEEYEKIADRAEIAAATAKTSRGI